MRLGRALLGGAAVLSGGRIAAFALSFLRNVILARILTKADFGIAATFSLALSLLEVAGRMAFGQQIIQAEEGDKEEFQASAHGFGLVLAAGSALLLVVFSLPIAQALKVPEAAWAFALLGVVPLARGLEHLDSYRVQRNFQYLPSVVCELVPQFVTTLLAWPLAVWLGDFRVVVWLMLLKAVVGTLMTHWVAKRPFRVTWRPGYVRQMWAFGWPLFLNGLLIFASQQADQILVGALLSLEHLAAYSLALTLVSTPWMVFAPVGSSLMLPLLARAQNDADRFNRHYRTCVEVAAMASITLMVPLVVCGEQLFVLLYGPRYAGNGTVVALLGAAAAVRFLRFAPAIAAQARADTVNQLVCNVYRTASLPLAGLALLGGGGAVSVAGCALLGEAGAAVFSLARLRRRQGVGLRVSANAVLYVICFLGCALLLFKWGGHHWSLWQNGVAILMLGGIACVSAWAALPGCRMMVQSFFRPERRVPGPKDASPAEPAGVPSSG